MPLFVTAPAAAGPVRLTTEWHSLVEGGCRIKLLDGDQDGPGAAAIIENLGDAAIHIEVRKGTTYELTQFIGKGESGVLGSSTRLFLSGRQETTMHHVTAEMQGSSSPGLSASAAAAESEGVQAGGSKRPVSGGAAEGGQGAGGEPGKRQRRMSPSRAAAATGGEASGVDPGTLGAAGGGAAAGGSAAAAAAGGGGGAAADPLDRVPDAPMHLMRVRGIPSWANEGFLGLHLGDLVHGDMRWCLVSNYMMDLGWLLSACPDLRRVPRLLLVHGEKAGGYPAQKLAQDMVQAGLGAGRCTLFAPPLPIQWGTHHSKAFIIQYDRGLRVIIFTANAIYPDCNNKSQGLYWQDFPPKDGASPPTSSFEQELGAYLEQLKLPPGDAARVRQLLAGHDFSAARGHIIASVPGYHTGATLHKWGHMRLRAVLNREDPWPARFQGAPLAAQFSSMGSLDDKWLTGEFGASLAAGRCGNVGAVGAGRLGMPAAAGPAGLQLVWTTVSEVQNSLEGWASGQSIPGPAKNVKKPFLQPYYRRWGGEVCGRQRAMPHIKTFLRFRPAGGSTTGAGAGSSERAAEQGEVEVAWLYVGSHNLSKAAWGALQKQGSQLMVRSYELGVLLTPAREAAYRASRWRGFSCTSPQAVPATAAAAAAAAAAGDPQPSAAAAAAAAAGQREPGETAPEEQPQVHQSVYFVQWQRGMPQEAHLAPSAAEGPAASGRGRGGEQQAAEQQRQLRVPLPIPYCLPPRRYEAGEQAWTVDEDWPGLDSLGRTRTNPYGAFYGLVEQMEWADVGH